MLGFFLLRHGVPECRERHAEEVCQTVLVREARALGVMDPVIPCAPRHVEQYGYLDLRVATARTVVFQIVDFGGLSAHGRTLSTASCDPPYSGSKGTTIGQVCHAKKCA
jgi:hypothetical protein